jgi:hypothetical protein
LVNYSDAMNVKKEEKKQGTKRGERRATMNADKIS